MSTATLDKLDKQINKLYLELSKDCNISFQEWDKDYCEVFTQNNNATIYYNTFELSNETIAHELLHIQQKSYGYVSSNHFFLYFQSHEFFKEVFTKNLCDFIGNFMEHYKMFPAFLEMGYAGEKFIQNGDKLQANLNDLSKIYLKVNGKLSPQQADFYIGNLLAILADPLPKNYSKHLEILEKKDKDLIQLVNVFWNSWKNFEVKKRDIFTNNESDIYHQFTEDLENWYESKTTKL